MLMPTRPSFRFVVASLLVLSLTACAHSAKQEYTRIKILHFSDYHSSAVEQQGQAGSPFGGVARAIGFIKSKAGPGTLTFSGGDMMNKGAPVWSDKYQCAEWPWFNGLIDAMALGNHDSDYGPDILAGCLTQISYPVLSANTLNQFGEPAFQRQGQDYAVFTVADKRVGVFALAGNDFSKLISAATAPTPGATFANRFSTAERVVANLRRQEHVDLVILIGHAHYEDDLALAAQVSGIDLILGSHSHRREELFLIPNTSTWYVSAGQYLSHIAELDIELGKQKQFNTNIRSISALLVPMNYAVEQDSALKQKVERMQAELESDPAYAAQFAVIGEIKTGLDAPHRFDRDSSLGNFVSDAVLKASKADVVLFTSSTFRKSLPRGVLRAHHLSDAMPYDNKLHRYELTGKEVKRLFDYSVQRMGSDFFSQTAGARISIVAGQLAEVLIKDKKGWQSLNETKVYQVVTSDYQSLVADGYKAVFEHKPYTVLPQSLRQIGRNALQRGDATAEVDGRIKVAPN